MSFASIVFVYFFLPSSVILLSIARKISTSVSLLACIALSAFFLASNDFLSLAVILLSIAFNYSVGKAILINPGSRKILSFAICLNLLLLAFFKYNPSSLWQGTWMPLGISFYTFSQISYLFELRTQRIGPTSFLEYLSYALFFPKLIAGPIARPSEFLPYIGRMGEWNIDRLLGAAAYFSIGLFKKAAIADQLEPFTAYAFGPGIDTASFYSAWQGSIAYGLQLYFDFSGYTDMAIGVALALGVCLPLNFDAPYRSVHITDFWRKWHITLSSFFRDYLYIPLGGNRKGTVRKYVNLFIVMTLCGIWHGSGWTFVLWGMLHGFYLITHNLWLSLKKTWNMRSMGKVGQLAGGLLTFLCVMASWVPFRASSLSSALHIWETMFWLPTHLPTNDEVLLIGCTVLAPLIVVLFFPTSQHWLRYMQGDNATGAAAANPTFRLTIGNGFVAGLLGCIGILFLLNQGGFIYGNF